jgi:nucleoside-diphosphate-sugar epimerase
MRIFVTGATGFIGSALVPELIEAGHQVLGLTRSAQGAKALQAAGADVQQGNLDDLDSLRDGAAKTDGVIHLAFNNDYSNFRKIVAQDCNMPGQPSTEDSPTAPWNPRSASEAAVHELTRRGVNTSIVRLSQIHDTRKQGLVTFALAIARDKGVSAYVGEGANRWPAAHVSDTAHLYRLAVEKLEPGAIYHAVAEEGVPVKAIAEALGCGLDVPIVSIKPEDAGAHFGWIAPFAAADMPSSSALTRHKLSWQPTGPGLLADLEAMDYSQA